MTVLALVTLQDHRREDFVECEAEITRYETLQECHLVGGGHDYRVEFIARSIAHDREIIESISTATSAWQNIQLHRDQIRHCQGQHSGQGDP